MAHDGVAPSGVAHDAVAPSGVAPSGVAHDGAPGVANSVAADAEAAVAVDDLLLLVGCTS